MPHFYEDATITGNPEDKCPLQNNEMILEVQVWRITQKPPWTSLRKEQLLSAAWRNPRHPAKACAARVASFLPWPMFFWGSNSSEKLSIFCLVGVVYCFNYLLSTLLTWSSELGSPFGTGSSSASDRIKPSDILWALAAALALSFSPLKTPLFLFVGTFLGLAYLLACLFSL